MFKRITPSKLHTSENSRRVAKAAGFVYSGICVRRRLTSLYFWLCTSQALLLGWHSRRIVCARCFHTVVVLWACFFS
ncbi:hypothetical protein AV530_014122 [Patagioenas fasciata monilis]|uniref:Uncharacterized protein n=1 Tax=Patagioenas fasciata monilis TaxID=372326 RepID=A0A1V4KDC8_PATFA|nr:hypothetical protein AV530_014122 [Patagioenas fasciata monilis]